MPRGGKRRGAGAPHSNLNALKTARHSPRARLLLRLVLLLSPFSPLGSRLLRLILTKKQKTIKKGHPKRNGGKPWL